MGASLEQFQVLINSVDKYKLRNEDRTEFVRIKTEVEEEIAKLF